MTKDELLETAFNDISNIDDLTQKIIDQTDTYCRGEDESLAAIDKTMKEYKKVAKRVRKLAQTMKRSEGK